jgi:hypothetical protein
MCGRLEWACSLLLLRMCGANADTAPGGGGAGAEGGGKHGWNARDAAVVGRVLTIHWWNVSKVRFIEALYVKYTKALTFENLCRELVTRTCQQAATAWGAVAADRRLLGANFCWEGPWRRRRSWGRGAWGAAFGWQAHILISTPHSDKVWYRDNVW